MNERNSKFQNNHAMAVLGVPDVQILELVDVHVKLVIRVEVHVGNEEMYDESSVPLSLEYSRDCILFGT